MSVSKYNFYFKSEINYIFSLSFKINFAYKFEYFIELKTKNIKIYKNKKIKKSFNELNHMNKLICFVLLIVTCCSSVSSLPHEEHHLKAQTDGMTNHQPKFVLTKEQIEQFK